MTSRGQTVPFIAVIGVIFTWCAALSMGLYQNSNTIGELTASVSDIQKSTENIPDIKAEVDWLAKQRGYSAILSEATSS